MTDTAAPYAMWIKHALVFVASIGLVWFAGIAPGMILGQAELAGAPPPSIGALFSGILSAWPIFIALAITQALAFHYLKRFTTPIYLSAVFVLALILAWRYATVAPV